MGANPVARKIEWDRGAEVGAFLALVVVLVALAFQCAGCATYTAVVEAPEEFWITAEEILYALWQDIWGLIELAL